MSEAQEFIAAIYPHVMRRGWGEGLNDHCRTQHRERAYEPGGFSPAWFTPAQGVWKLLLPGDFTNDLFIADASLGAVPIDLSKSYRRVVVYSWYERSAELLRKRAQEAGASNVEVLDRVDARELGELGCRIGVSVVVITADLISLLGGQGMENGLARIMGCVSGFCAETWTNVFVFAKRQGKTLTRLFPRYCSRAGMSAAELKKVGTPLGLHPGELYHLKGSLESMAGICMKGLRVSPGAARFPVRGWKFGHGDIGRAVRRHAAFARSQVLVMRRGEGHPTWLHGFLSHLQDHGTGERTTVRRCMAGKPNMVILEMAHGPGRLSVCRMPLGKGEITGNRAANNYAALQRLTLCGEMSRIVPRPLCHGTYQGQKYYVETFLSGEKRTLVSGNHARIYDMVRPALLGLYTDAGLLTRIDETVFRSLAGEGLSRLKRYARSRNDLGMIQDLDRALRDLLLNTQDRLPQVHGDFKIENMLFSSRRLGGIIDWDLSAVFGAPYLDLLYFYAYSFHHSPFTSGRGIMDFILDRMLCWDPGPVLQNWLDDYSSSLGLSPVWQGISGILFWLHYVTRIMGTAMPVYDQKTYRKNIRVPLAVISEKMRRIV